MSTRVVSKTIDLEAPMEDVSEYITEINNNGIRIHPKNESGATEVQLDGAGMKVIDAANEVSVAEFGASGAQIGSEDSTHIILDEDSFIMLDTHGDEFAHIGSPIGAQITDTFVYTVETQPVAPGYFLTYTPLGSVTVKINDHITTNYRISTVDNKPYLSITTILSEDSIISAQYEIDGEAKYYTMGERIGDAGPWSMAEGRESTASGQCSHVEGMQSTAKGFASHAEGYFSTAIGHYSHAEGGTSFTRGQFSHAENSGTANGNYSHAENSGTAGGEYSHAENDGIAIGPFSHAENDGMANGNYSHAENSGTAEGEYSHAEGRATKANGNYSHSEGSYTKANGTYSHAEGEYTTASGVQSHAEGASTTASGSYSHAEGASTTASMMGSHAEGHSTTASGLDSHAEGSSTIASGSNTHAEGGSTTASGNYSHAEGYNTSAIGSYSHTEGSDTVASIVAQYSHSQNQGTKASKYAQTVLGTYNIAEPATSPTVHPSGQNSYGKHAVIIGNGTADDARSNALTVDWSGNICIALDTTAISGTTDGDLYNAIVTLEWDNDVIV